jgi:hypothetical protein
MNIFILDSDINRSAQLLCDQHLIKQILELAQTLSVHGYGVYKPTHKNHPVTIWVGQNLRYCFKYLEALQQEYYKRTGKTHKSYIDTINYKDNIPNDYTDLSNLFPIKNDLELVKHKYIEWTSRPKPMIPRWTEHKFTPNLVTP